MDLFQLSYLRGRLTATRLFTTVGLVIVGLALASAASATLIGDSLEYDGHVKSGAATGIEQHAVAPAFPPITFTLPVTNGPLAAPLKPAHALSGTETEFGDFLGSTAVQHVIITIQAQSPVDPTFVNPLDPGIALPILFDGTFHSSVAGKIVSIAGIGIEDLPSSVLPPFGSPGSSSITGLGTLLFPLHIQLGLSASQVANHNGAVKVHLYYTTSNVPEPSTMLMLLTGAVGAVCVAARRRG
jgi:hypothetical protein